MYKFQSKVFKLIDILVILTMVFGAPMNVAAAPRVREESPVQASGSNLDESVELVQAPTAEPTQEPVATEEPTQEPVATEEPTQEPIVEPTLTTEPTIEPTSTPLPVLTPYIQSDKEDYLEGEVVTLTSGNWQPGESVHLIVNDNIGQTWSQSADIQADAAGAFTYQFQLPDWFVAQYMVYTYGAVSGVATMTFTDAAKITAKSHQGQKSSGTYTTGNITTYQEGDYINFRFTLEDTGGASNGVLDVRFTGDDGTCLFFDGTFALGTHDDSAPAVEHISGATPTVTPVGSPVATNFGTSSGEWVQRLNISFSGNGEAIVNYYLRLSPTAGECSGASQHSRLNPAGGSVSQTGAQNVPVPANQVVELPEITVIKMIDRNGNGDFESAAAEGEYCFTLDGGSCISTNASGKVVFTNVAPNGAHTITETQLDFAQGTYGFISGSGTNCTFSGSVASATVLAGTTATDATCTFNNRRKPLLTVNKVLVPDSDGGLFNLQIDGSTAGTGANVGDGGTTGAIPVDVGVHTVGETAGTGTDLSDYTIVIGGDCAADGTITLAASDTKTCTITNTVQEATLIVKKILVNDNGGTKTNADFSFQVNDDPAISFETDGQNDLTVVPGTYSVVEAVADGYTTTYDNCSDIVLPPGGTATCTITNDDNAGTLIVKKVVVNDNGGVLHAEDFSFSVNDDPAVAFEADGENQLNVNAGTYNISETAVAGYITSYDNCNGVVVPNGGSATCTITNDDQPGTLIVKKVVVNDNGGTLEADDFSFSVNGDSAIGFEADGQNDLIIDAGTYNITETAVAGYAASYDNCASVVIPNGGTQTCTITNDDQAAYIIVAKITDPSGSTQSFEFDSSYGDNFFLMDGESNDSGPLSSGTYSVSELVPSGWQLKTAVCSDGSNPSSIGLSLGETVTCTFTNDPLPTVTIVKTASSATLPEPGGVFTFTLDITNTSVEDVEITGLGDTNTLSPENSPECLALVHTTLTPGQSVSCKYDVTHTEAGIYENTAEVTVADNEGNPAGDSDSETVTVIDVLPTVTIVKTASPTTLPEPGGTFNYTVTITNTSVEKVTISAFDDTQITDCDTLVGTELDAGESVVCEYAIAHTEYDNYPNVASVTIVDNEENEASASDEELVTISDVLPTVQLIKEVDTASLPEPGGVFTFTLSITNTSVETIQIMTLTDDNALSTECLDLLSTTLVVGETASCTYSVTHTDAGSYTNTASVTVRDNEGNPAGDSDTETVTVTDVLPTVTIVKTASPTTLPEPGGTFNYTVTITNTSVEKVTISAFDDTQTTDCDTLVGTELDAGESVVCEYAIAHTEYDNYPNVASVTIVDNEENEATASDEELVTISDVLPTVQLIKEVDTASLPEPGGVFTFTLSITNTSVETIQIMTLTDDNALSTECLDLLSTTLVVGETASCTYSVTHTDAGSYTNTASVTVRDNEGNPAGDTDSETVTVTDVLPIVTLNKTVSPTTLPEPGGTFTFTLTITNTSVEPVEITALTDDNALSVECLDLVGATLAAGESTSCTYTVSHIDFGSYPNTASITVKDNEGNEAGASDDETIAVTDVLPVITVDKSANPTAVPETGGDVVFTFVVTNGSVEPVTITELSDSDFGTLSGNDDCKVGTLLSVGGFCSFTYTAWVEGDYSGPDHANTLTARAEDNENNAAADDDDATVDFADVAPAIEVTKTANPITVPETGGDVLFTFSVKNASTKESVTITSLSDSIYGALAGDADCQVGTTLDAGASCEFSLTKWVEGDYSGSDHNNKFTAVAEDNDGTDAADDDDAAISFTDVLPDVTLTKIANAATLPEPGVFTFTLTITNNSLEGAVITTLTDDNALSQACSDLIGTTLAAGASASCQYEVTHPSKGTYPNTAKVTLEDNEGNSASGSDEETVTVTDGPDNLTLTKTADADHVTAGQQIGFTITVHNAGPGTAYNASLSDTLPTGKYITWSIATAVPGCSIVGNVLTCNLGDLASGTTVTVHVVSPTSTCTCGLFDNTATLSSDANLPISATASTASYCDLRVSKTANPTFTRTFNWSIEKSVDRTLVKQVGGSATFKYAVTVKQTGSTDGNWMLTGKITIVNPNPTLEVTGVNVTDAVNNGGNCVVVDGSGITIPAGGSKVLDYTCTYASRPISYSGKNKATVTWPAEMGMPHTSQNAYAFFTFGGCGSSGSGNPSNVNKTITITDTFNDLTTTLGSVAATTYGDKTWKTYTYLRSIPVPANACKSYTNTAKIVETDQNASKTVTVCGPIKTGALSKGYWQNKNGQSIIKNSASVCSKCKLASWLRAYAPFQDLSASASCNTTATYVYNIIKAADSGSASMNAMLKAQMLAVALDVYFSDPALGGNKINAPAPIGGVTIDLTNIKGQNASDGFGNAARMTISQMLTYAAGKSNAGGSVWYGNVKSTQEKAKNAFDAIANDQVFAP